MRCTALQSDTSMSNTLASSSASFPSCAGRIGEYNNIKINSTKKLIHYSNINCQPHPLTGNCHSNQHRLSHFSTIFAWNRNYRHSFYWKSWTKGSDDTKGTYWFFQSLCHWKYKGSHLFRTNKICRSVSSRQSRSLSTTQTCTCKWLKETTNTVRRNKHSISNCPNHGNFGIPLD